MKKRLGLVFWSESAIASAGTLLAALTLVWPDWIESVTGLDPDRHSGTLEWLIAVGCCLAAAVASVLARREWRRVAATAA
jgi:hypothetical protein